MVLSHLLFSTLLLLISFLAAFSVNAIESVLFLILCFCIAGIILFMLNAEFLGLVYIVVYVGAVAVLFLFIIMMLSIKQQHSLFEKLLYTNSKIKYFFLFLIFFYPILSTFNIGLDFLSLDSSVCLVLNENLVFFDTLNNIDVFGQILFNYYVIYFLLAGIILLIALVGCILITHQSSK